MAGIEVADFFRRRGVFGIALLILGSVAGGAWSAQTDGGVASDAAGETRWRVAGFGTVGTSYHDGDGLRFRRDVSQGGGVRAKRFGMEVDSRIGLQLDGVFTSRWSTMVQLVSRLDADGKWDPAVSWAYLRYAFKDSVELRLGRMVSDLYLEGDSRNVGFAHTTVRPNPEVFGVLGPDTYDGAELSLRWALAGGGLRLKLYGGRSRGDSYYRNVEEALPRSRTLGTTLEWEGRDLVVRASWGEVLTRDKDHFAPLARGLDQLGAATGNEAMRQRAVELLGDARIRFGTLGTRYERDAFSLQAIATRMHYSLEPSYRGWSGAVTAAYRIGNWKPYLTWSRNVFEGRSAALDFSPAATAVGPGGAAAVMALQAGYQDAMSMLNQDQRSTGIGVRYDFSIPVALKFQLDHVQAKRSTLLLATDGGPVRDRALTVFTVVLDAVF